MKEALNLALNLAIMHHSDDGYAELRSKVRQLAKEALAQDELCSPQEPVASPTSPPKEQQSCDKRPWVGLTGLEQKELMTMSAREAVFATEAKLKEKNT